MKILLNNNHHTFTIEQNESKLQLKGEKMDTTLTIQTPERLKNRLEKGAEEEMTSQASIVRRALDEYLPEGERQ